MGVLTHNEILKQRTLGKLIIEPFDKKNLGANSYDVTLSTVIKKIRFQHMDIKKNYTYETHEITKKGYLLEPPYAYLAVTNERTYTPHHVPIFHGRSSVGRYFISTHCTAGYGDIGFNGFWTLEILVKFPVMIYPNFKIGQIEFLEPKGIIDKQYNGVYQNEQAIPIEAKAENF